MTIETDSVRAFLDDFRLTFSLLLFLFFLHKHAIIHLIVFTLLHRVSLFLLFSLCALLSNIQFILLRILKLYFHRKYWRQFHFVIVNSRQQIESDLKLFREWFDFQWNDQRQYKWILSQRKWYRRRGFIWFSFWFIVQTWYVAMKEYSVCFAFENWKTVCDFFLKN